MNSLVLPLLPVDSRYNPHSAIHNNLGERELRAVAIGRKNWEFAGSDEGGRRAAILYSLVASCKALKVEPWAYLRDVLERVGSTPQSRIAELLPDQWRATSLAPEPAKKL
ncbi:MAG: transposase domain-containing protein [Planctomycetes bacterium]|nr:transposase domain-containing protein [Planctomycetota bacterium]